MLLEVHRYRLRLRIKINQAHELRCRGAAASCAAPSTGGRWSEPAALAPLHGSRLLGLASGAKCAVWLQVDLSCAVYCRVLDDSEQKRVHHKLRGPRWLGACRALPLGSLGHVLQLNIAPQVKALRVLALPTPCRRADARQRERTPQRQVHARLHDVVVRAVPLGSKISREHLLARHVHWDSGALDDASLHLLGAEGLCHAHHGHAGGLDRG
mmetsp:Transcript_12832/g.31155  ORF Transcript_12832/g.31155 Transcript_12832/m.31155 type:complete len:212 (-) Transcript_12832:1112-1747(-)